MKNSSKLVCVLGHHGFIGSALTKKLLKTEIVTHVPSAGCRIIYDFASPTHEGFETNLDYHFNTIISRMAYLMRFCADHKIKYVYPSSALVYELERPFKTFKEIKEKMQKLFPVESLALRIFPVYGVGETRTVIYQWCKDIKANKRPVVFGDGTQKRDLIYIDDVVDNIIRLAKSQKGIRDIGAGKPHTFKQIVSLINKEAKTNLKPVYVKPPAIYSEGIFCQNPVKCKINLREGITKVLASL
jgi:nucleoside-diphosphate-sugar epimerase